jgi:hypothetical protein
MRNEPRRGIDFGGHISGANCLLVDPVPIETVDSQPLPTLIKDLSLKQGKGRERSPGKSRSAKRVKAPGTKSCFANYRRLDFIGGQPTLQLTIVGHAIGAKLQ